MRFDPTKFVRREARPLPVFLLLDVSGSMNGIIDPENVVGTGQTFYEDGQWWELVEGGTPKIQVLNEALKKMIRSFSRQENGETEILVTIITFGDRAELFRSPTPAHQIEWEDLTASGETAMGEAFQLTKKLIEDRKIISSRAYRPTIVLVSDGRPTDSWESPLLSLTKKGRSSKCFYMAMGIGDADRNVLSKFIEGTPILAQRGSEKIPNRVFTAEKAEEIRDFFQRVTMSVISRSYSTNPNQAPQYSASTKEDDDDEYW